MTTTNLFTRYFKADELHNDDRGWAYNLAIFRLVYLGVVVLPFALGVVRWTAEQMPQLPRDAWVPISFYRYLPYELIANATLGHALAITLRLPRESSVRHASATPSPPGSSSRAAVTTETW